jgi:hypothetical protein
MGTQPSRRVGEILFAVISILWRSQIHFCSFFFYFPLFSWFDFLVSYSYFIAIHEQQTAWENKTASEGKGAPDA